MRFSIFELRFWCKTAKNLISEICTFRCDFSWFSIFELRFWCKTAKNLISEICNFRFDFPFLSSDFGFWYLKSAISLDFPFLSSDLDAKQLKIWYLKSALLDAISLDFPFLSSNFGFWYLKSAIFSWKVAKRATFN